MHLAQLWQSMEARLQAWRQRWWPHPPQPGPRGEAGRVESEVEDVAADLANETALLEELRGRVGENERRVVRLTAQVAECVKAGYESQAWPLVLELDEVRRTLAEDQAALRRQEQVCWSQEFHLRQLRRRLERLREQAGRPAPGRS